MSTQDAAVPQAPRVIGTPAHVLIVSAPYYKDVVAGLSAGAGAILDQAQSRQTRVEVAGAFELPQAIRIALTGRMRYDGFVALGCVVRGETDHYDFICAATMNGLMQVALDHAIALGAGLLTVDDLDQARARAGMFGANKGAEAAVACLHQINLLRSHGVCADGI